MRIGERRETVEPRVMQVLVVLARAQGSVVSRDQLVERCRGGRIVGDDAVNNCIVKMRALAALAPQSAFEIETIPRVGSARPRRVIDCCGGARGGNRQSLGPGPVTAWPLLVGRGSCSFGVGDCRHVFFRRMGRIASGPRGLLAIELESVESDLAIASVAAGQPPRFIDQDVSDTQRISYAPDGTLAEIADQSGAMSIRLANRREALRPLLQIRTHSAGGLADSMRWSPDGSELAYTDVTPGGFVYRVISRSGAPVAQCAAPALDVGYPDWSADGKSLQQARGDANGWRVWRTAIARPDQSVPVSPYGWIFVRNEGTATFGVKSDSIGVWRMDGKPRRVADGPHGYPWRLANGQIVYLDSSDPAHARIMAVPITGGPAVALGYAPDIVRGLAVAVDPRTGQVV